MSDNSTMSVWNTASYLCGVTISESGGVLTANTIGPATSYQWYLVDVGWASRTVPSDTTFNNLGEMVTIQGSGSLVKSGYSFKGWNTLVDGSWTDYDA